MFIIIIIHNTNLLPSCIILLVASVIKILKLDIVLSLHASGVEWKGCIAKLYAILGKVCARTLKFNLNRAHY